MALLCSCDCLVDSSPTSDNCVGEKKLKEALQFHFKYTSFRPGQLEALLPVEGCVCSNAHWWRKVTLHVFGTLGCEYKGNWDHCKSFSKPYGSTGECMYMYALVRYSS